MERNVGSRTGRSICARFVLALILYLPTVAGAQTYSVLYNFLLDPAHPEGPLVQGADGNFYGTAGCSGDCRPTVFRMEPTGIVTTVAELGAQPSGGLIQAADGNFYGMTTGGDGTIFKVDSSGNLTTLHNFNHDIDGSGPVDTLVESTDGDFYGVTAYGGSYLHGTAFKIDSSGNLTTLHNFNQADGAMPQAGLIQAADGNFYGTTAGGGANLLGTVFRMDASGTLTTLHSFTGIDGSHPQAALLQADDGNFYGTTREGGTGNGCSSSCGTVFRIDSSGTLTSLHSFAGGIADGAFPAAGLVQATDGNFYGTTSEGGSCGGSDGCGTIYKINTSGSITTFHSFTGVDGSHVSAGLIQASDGNFYGTTRIGGGGGAGTLYRIDSAGDLTTLHAFLRGNANPYASLVQANDGNLYGTTYQGGAGCCGTVFRIDSLGNMTILHSFLGPEGLWPSASLIQAADDTFYGATSGGGGDSGCFYGCGTVFKMDSSGNLTMLHGFALAEGTGPSALIRASDGNFYGTASGGGINSSGTVFRLDAFGALTILHDFSGADGAEPHAPLIQATDGYLYGTTTGGNDGNGTTFKIDVAGNLTTLHSFAGGDGSYASAGLIQASDGNFYGTTAGGGASNFGTVFRMDSSGSLTTLHSFTSEEGTPYAGLVQASDGFLYGTTETGGGGPCGMPLPTGCGTIFKMDLSGTLTAIHSFVGYDGNAPVAPLIQAADGNLYGTTAEGGASGLGVVFRVALCSPPLASSNSPVCSGQTLQLSAYPSAGATYSWSGPNGFSSNLQAPTIPNATAADSGTYTVTVTSGTCAPAQTSVDVSVNPGVPPGPVISPLGCVPPNTPGLTASVAATAGDTYNWTISGGTITGGQGTNVITFTSGEPGVVIRLTAVESNTSCSGSDTKTVQVDYADMPASSPFHDFICKIAENGITAGCGSGSFCPGNSVLRSQMAVFLLRGEHGSAYVPPPAVGNFADVLPTNPFAPWIEQLNNEGITAGCDAVNYCPSNPVSRAGMAVFLLVAEHGTGYTPPACAGIFTDVACPGPFTNWIERLYNEGITGGCSTNPLQYCPGNSVTRAQMAVFLTATFGLP